MDAAERSGDSTSMSLERPSTLISSVQRAVHLLEAVAGHPNAVPAKVLAKEVGLPLGTTYHLLRTLTFEGYLRRLPDGCYVLGEGVIRLLDQGRSQASLSRARASLLALTGHLGAPAYLSFFEEGEIVIKDITDTPRHPRIDLWVGFHDAAHATALGKSVLASLEPTVLEDYLAQHALPDLTPHTLTSRESVLRCLGASTRSALRASLSTSRSTPSAPSALRSRCWRTTSSGLSPCLCLCAARRR